MWGIAQEFGLPNPLLDNWAVKSLLTRVKRVKGNAVKQKLPNTASILLKFYALFNLSISFDSSFWAVCLVAFFDLFRKSHLLTVSGNKFNSDLQFAEGCFKLYTWDALIHVKWSKTF